MNGDARLGRRRERVSVACDGAVEMARENGPLDTAGSPAWHGSLVSRRTFLGVAGTTALGAVLAACTGSSGGPTMGGSGGARIPGDVPGPQPVSGGTYGGRIVVGWDDEPIAFGDPPRAWNLLDYDVVTTLVFFGGLLAYEGQLGGAIPNLAASLPDISQDGLTLTFQLRPDITFHNGRRIEAEDFKWSWERAIKPGLRGSWGKGYFSSIVGWDALRSGKADTLEGVEVIDPRTLAIHLSKPDFEILNLMALNLSAPIPREEVERLGNEGFADMPVGYGPFRIESHDKTGQTAVFTRFDGYTWKGLPYVDEVEFRWGLDSGLIVRQLQGGDIDVAGNGIPTSQVSSVLAAPATRPLAVEVPVLIPEWVEMNPKVTPFDDVRVRQALNYAVDRDAICKITHSAPFGSPLPKDLPNFPHTFEPYTFDAARARSLLAEAGVEGGFSAQLTFVPSDAAVAQILQQQLRVFGVELSLNQVSSNASYELAVKGDFQMMKTLIYLLQPTAADLFENVYATGGYANDVRYSNPEVDALVSEARSLYNEATRNRLYAKVEQIVGEDAVGIFLSSARYFGGRSERLQNFHNRGDMGSFYDRMWLQA
jgi:peptide/nickel transport system substrate-binding protein